MRTDPTRLENKMKNTIEGLIDCLRAPPTSLALLALCVIAIWEFGRWLAAVQYGDIIFAALVASALVAVRSGRADRSR